MKPRKNPSQRMRALLQQEIESRCPFCQSEDVDTFQVHHINEQPDDDRFENLLMVCPTCHSKITAGTIPCNTIYAKKYELMMLVLQGKDKASGGKVSSVVNVSELSIKDVGVAVVGSNNKITTNTIKRKVVKYPPDSIGGDSIKANYVDHLIKRYNEFASWQRTDFKYPAFNAHLKRKFKIGPHRAVFNIPLSRFDELVDYIQYRICNTRLGRIKGKSQKLFSSFKEYCDEQREAAPHAHRAAPHANCAAPHGGGPKPCSPTRQPCGPSRQTCRRIGLPSCSGA